jgi:hypothetical protein
MLRKENMQISYQDILTIDLGVIIVPQLSPMSKVIASSVCKAWYDVLSNDAIWKADLDDFVQKGRYEHGRLWQENFFSQWPGISYRKIWSETVAMNIKCVKESLLYLERVPIPFEDSKTALDRSEQRSKNLQEITKGFLSAIHLYFLNMEECSIFDRYIKVLKGYGKANAMGAHIRVARAIWEKERSLEYAITVQSGQFGDLYESDLESIFHLLSRASLEKKEFYNVIQLVEKHVTTSGRSRWLIGLRYDLFQPLLADRNFELLGSFLKHLFKIDKRIINKLFIENILLQVNEMGCPEMAKQMAEKIGISITPNE